MAALRNKQFWKGTANSGSWTTVYTVPAGKLAVIHGVTMLHTDSGSASGLMGLGGTYVISQPLTAYGTSGAMLTWQGRVAVPAGGTIQVACSSSHHVDMVISGAEYYV